MRTASVSVDTPFRITLDRSINDYHGPETVVKNGTEVPGFLVDAFQFLEKRQYQKHEGIFRKEGARSRMACLSRVVMGDQSLNSMQELTVIDVCCLVKKFFRALDQPLLNNLEKNLVTSATEQLEQMMILTLVNAMEPKVLTTLSYLMSKLNDLLKYEDITKMSAVNLGSMFAPCLFDSQVSITAPQRHDRSTSKTRPSAPMEAQKRKADRQARVIEILIRNCSFIGPPADFVKKTIEGTSHRMYQYQNGPRSSRQPTRITVEKKSKEKRCSSLSRMIPKLGFGRSQSSSSKRRTSVESSSSQSTFKINGEQYVLKPSNDLLKLSEDVLKSSENVLKPSNDLLKLSDDLLKPSNDPVKPLEDVFEPSEDVKEPEENVLKLCEDVAPSEDVFNPSNDQLKPSEDEQKPSEDVKKPSEDEQKPSEDVKKPSEDEQKPSEDVKKPSEDVKKPPENVLKPSNDVPKSSSTEEFKRPSLPNPNRRVQRPAPDDVFRRPDINFRNESWVRDHEVVNRFDQVERQAQNILSEQMEKQAQYTRPSVAAVKASGLVKRRIEALQKNDKDEKKQFGSQMCRASTSSFHTNQAKPVGPPASRVNLYTHPATHASRSGQVTRQAKAFERKVPLLRLKNHNAKSPGRALRSSTPRKSIGQRKEHRRNNAFNSISRLPVLSRRSLIGGVLPVEKEPPADDDKENEEGPDRRNSILPFSSIGALGFGGNEKSAPLTVASVPLEL